MDRVMQDLSISVVGRTLFSADFGPVAGAEIRTHTPTSIRLGVVRALSPAGLEKLPIPAKRRFDRAVAHHVARPGHRLTARCRRAVA
ncbi:hypothetical protein ACRAKI_19010 [Saccharothrix isguenensis]